MESTLTAQEEATESMDKVELAITKSPPVDIPTEHLFTPGLYARTIRIKAGTLFTSMAHKTEHPFVISQGVIMVRSHVEGDNIYEAPHIGVTMPGTRRVLFAETNVVWTTFHATKETDVEKICLEILDHRENPLLKDKPELVPGWRESLPHKKS